MTKDAGDDSDVTDGMLVCAAVRRRTTGGIFIDGGEGVGRVTKAGLDQPVGAAAINHVPRAMIEEQVRTVCTALGYSGGMDVVISIPGGAEVAARTFNPKLGIVGGLSILGTSGIVEPMSESAIADTIALELRQLSAAGAQDVILTPGNYGLDFLRSHALVRRDVPVVKCANFIGAALDGAVVAGFVRILLVGHIGKLVKLAGGVMNTHSRYADCRMELLCAHAAVCGGDAALCRAVMEAPTTDAALEFLQGAGLQEPVLRSLLQAIDGHVRRRVGVGARCWRSAVFQSIRPSGPKRGRTGGVGSVAMKKGTFYAVGVGPGDPELLTQKALRILQGCAVIAAPRGKGGAMTALSIAARAVDLSQKTIVPLPLAMERGAAARRMCTRRPPRFWLRIWMQGVIRPWSAWETRRYMPAAATSWRCCGKGDMR